MRPAPWGPPAEVPDAVALECRRWLDWVRSRDGEAQDGLVERWLLTLLMGVAGDRSEDDVRAKLKAFRFALAGRPALCFTPESLRGAQRRFRFWPSAAELIEFADEVERGARETRQRCGVIVERHAARGGGDPEAEPPRRWSKDEADAQRERNRAAQRDQNARVIQALRERGEWIETPVRAPGESERDYVARLVEHIRSLPGPQKVGGGEKP